MSLRSAAQPNLPRHAYDIPLRRRIRWARFGRADAPAHEPAPAPAATVVPAPAAPPKGACC